jgi:hypothetical protein
LQVQQELKKRADEEEGETTLEMFLKDNMDTIIQAFSMPASTEQLNEEQLRWVTDVVEVKSVCTICDKITTPGHVNSKTHIDRATVWFGVELLVGANTHPVPRPIFQGYSDPDLDVAGFKAYWGTDVESMALKALSRLQRQGVFVKCSSNKAGRVYRGADITACSLACMPFDSECSKYKMSKALRWAEVPLTRGAWLHTPLPLQEKQGWWPVVSVSFASTCEAHAYVTPGSSDWFVCVYQLLEACPPAWWCEYHHTVDMSRPNALKFVAGGVQLKPPPKAPPPASGVWREPSLAPSRG